jgi:hypothetical protein
MPEKLDAIIPTITPLIKLLRSPTEQEALAALRMLLRLLSKHGLVIHALADRVERGGPNAAEMQQIYDAAYQKGYDDGSEQGRRSAMPATAQPWHVIGTATADVGESVSGAFLAADRRTLRPLQASACRQRPSLHLRAALVRRRHAPPPLQASWLRDLFMRKFAGRIE